MFSTTEVPSTRIIKITIVTADEEIDLRRCPKKFTKTFLATRTFPSEQRVADFAKQLVCENWVDRGTATVVVDDPLENYSLLASDKADSRQTTRSDTPASTQVIRRIVLAETIKAVEELDELTLFVESINIEVSQLEYSRANSTFSVRKISEATAIKQ